MRIQKAEIRRLSLPIVNGFGFGLGTVSSKETLIIKLYTEDGLIGHGETSILPLFTEETSTSVIFGIKNKILPLIINRDFDTPAEFEESYKKVEGYLSGKNGVECAFWDIYSQYKNVPLEELFGGVRDKIEVGESIGFKDTVDQTLEEVELRINEGYKRIKLKIKPGWDLILVSAVRNRWPSVNLTVDANSTYKLADHENILISLDRFGLSMIEQPLAEDNLADHAILQKKIKTPICLDESIRSLSNLETAIKIGACKIVNIKPARVGGIVESLKMHDYTESHGIGVMCGGLLETGIGRAFNIALASKTNFIYPADMSPYQFYFSEDLIDPSYIVNQDGYIDVPESPGIGYNIRDDLIEKYTIDKVVV